MSVTGNQSTGNFVTWFYVALDLDQGKRFYNEIKWIHLSQEQITRATYWSDSLD